MEFMTVKEAATKWGLSERRLQTICNEGMVPEVIKFGKAWAIPMDAERPVDKRIKSGKYIKEKDGELMIMVMDYIKVFESGRLVIRFYDGTEFECETE